jgi:hypothetical protein
VSFLLVVVVTSTFGWCFIILYTFSTGLATSAHLVDRNHGCHGSIMK